MGPYPGCRLEHEPHARVHFGEPLHLLVCEDSGIRMREKTDLNCLFGHVVAIVKDVAVAVPGQVPVKSGLESGTLSEGEKSLRAAKKCTLLDGFESRLRRHHATFLDGGAERAVFASVAADSREG